MTHIVGRQEHIGIGIESTSGTAVAPTYWLPVTDKTYDDKANIVMDDSAYGVLAEHADAKLLKQWADGSFSGHVYQNSIGVLLILLCGNEPTPSASDGEYTHVFEQTNSAVNKTATIAMKDANLDLRSAGATLDSLQFTLETGSFFNYEAQFIGKKGSSASNSPSRSLENVFLPTHAEVKLASSQAGLAGASPISVRSANWTFAKNVEDQQYLGSKDIATVLNRQMAITGTLEVTYDGSTYKDFVFNETARALRLSLTNDAATLANNSNPSLTFDFYKVRFHDWERSRGNNDIVTETVQFTALADPSNSWKQYTITLLNGVSDYTPA